jgi:biopolymer transport protein ExbB/TolQ
MSILIIIDLVTIALLIASVAYYFVAAFKLRNLTAALRELEPLITAFSLAVDKSEVSVNKFKENLENTQPEPEENSMSAIFSRSGKTTTPSEEQANQKRIELVQSFFKKNVELSEV